MNKYFLFGAVSAIGLLGSITSASASYLQEASPSEITESASANNNNVDLPSGYSSTPSISASTVTGGRNSSGGDIFLHPDTDPLSPKSGTPLRRYYDRIGAKLTFMGRQGHGGLFGYFSRVLATHNGAPLINPETGQQVTKTQVIYGIPGDGYDVLEGNLRNSDGEALTLKRLIELQDGAETVRQNLVEVLGAQKGTSQPPASNVEPQQNNEAEKSIVKKLTSPLLLPDRPNDAFDYPQGVHLTPEEPKNMDSKWMHASIDANSFLKDINEHTSHFVVGENKSAPMMYLTVDPRCEYCHALWYELRPYVLSGKIRATIILTSLKGEASLSDAAQILSSHRAGALWMDGVGNNPSNPISFTTDTNDSRYIAYAKAVSESNNRFLIHYSQQIAPGQVVSVPMTTFVSKGHVYAHVGTIDPLLVALWVGRLTGSVDRGISETIK